MKRSLLFPFLLRLQKAWKQRKAAVDSAFFTPFLSLQSEFIWAVVFVLVCFVQPVSALFWLMDCSYNFLLLPSLGAGDGDHGNGEYVHEAQEVHGIASFDGFHALFVCSEFVARFSFNLATAPLISVYTVLGQ